MYLEIYAELVKLVFDRELTLEPPRNPDGSVKPVADGILGGPHTLDGFLDMARAAGVTRRYVPITWESDRVRADYGHLNLDVVVEDTLVRMVGSTPNPASWLGIVDVPGWPVSDGAWTAGHGGRWRAVAAACHCGSAGGQWLRAEVERHQTLKQARPPEDRSRAEALPGPGRPTGHRQAGHLSQSQDSPGRARCRGFPGRKSEPLCWISREHLSAVTRELTGILVSNGKYSLTAICTHA